MWVDYTKQCSWGTLTAEQIVASLDECDGEQKQAQHETVVLEVDVVDEKQARVQKC